MPPATSRRTRHSEPELRNSGIPAKGCFPARTRSARFYVVCTEFVVTSPDVVLEAAHVALKVGMAVNSVWGMPETASADRVGVLTALAAILAGFRVSSRPHVHTWADARGT